MKKDLRVLYAAGPGNVIGTYHHWTAGRDDPSQVSVTWSGQFYDLCRVLGIRAYVVSSCKDKKIIKDGQFIIEHRPMLISGASGILFHFVYLLYGLRLVVSAVRFRANVAIVVDGTTHWFILSLLPLLGIKVIPSLQCVLWCKYIPLKWTQKFFLRLDRDLFSKSCSAILAMSDDIAKQVEQVAGGKPKPVIQYFPLYRREEFLEINQPTFPSSKFRVLFAGRIEVSKGVFDLLEISKRFVSSGEQHIEFNICGSGSMLANLQNAAKEAEVDSFFYCHGHCNKIQMREMFNCSHVVIVPTRTDFVEGFNQVVVEGVLSGRPVITSSVCPALNSVREAVVEVPPNDIEAYGDAILKLRDDQNFYERKRKSCLSLQEQFYNSYNSWGAALQSILLEIGGRASGIK